MSYYRIYRPQTLDDIDNEAVREVLRSLLKKKPAELPHAYLLSGQRGAGKTTAARLIAKIFNCRKPSKTGPCGTCQECMSIAKGTNMDVLEIDAASNRGIDEIRSLKERIGLAPTHAAFTVYIIDEVHMLTTEAFNALLKTLEEPPPHAVFVLATTELMKVPVTIRSRCLPIRFRAADTDEILRALKRIIKSEKIAIEDESLSLLCANADGSFRDAVKMLEQLSLTGDRITQDAVKKSLGALSEGEILRFLAMLSDRDGDSAIALIRNFAAEGRDMKAFVSGCLKTLGDMVAGTPLSGGEGAVFGTQDIVRLSSLLHESYEMMRFSPVPELPVMVATVTFIGDNSVNRQGRRTGSDTHEDDKPQNDDPAGTVQGKAGQSAVHGKNPDSVKPAMENDAGSPTYEPAAQETGLITRDRLTECWKDLIEDLKPYNHSIAGVLRSAKPRSVDGGVVVIEAFYQFHKDKLSEMRTREAIAASLKKLFGEHPKVEIVLGKK